VATEGILLLRLLFQSRVFRALDGPCCRRNWESGSLFDATRRRLRHHLARRFAPSSSPSVVGVPASILALHRRRADVRRCRSRRRYRAADVRGRRRCLAVDVAARIDDAAAFFGRRLLGIALRNTRRGVVVDAVVFGGGGSAALRNPGVPLFSRTLFYLFDFGQSGGGSRSLLRLFFASLSFKRFRFHFRFRRRLRSRGCGRRFAPRKRRFVGSEVEWITGKFHGKKTSWRIRPRGFAPRTSSNIE